MLRDFIEMQIKQSRPVTIQNGHSQTRLPAQHHGQFVEVEAAVDEQLSLRELRRQIEFAPDVLAATGKHRFGPRAVALPVRGQVKDALQIGPGAAIAAVLLRLAQGLADQVLGQDGLLAVRFVAGPGGLKIETDRAIRSTALKFRQLTHIFAGDHFTLS